ncbi:hypothetical protein [Alloprevotella tannerae]|nr:hypothetical protein [Alloprevotella tannerae]
MSTLENNVMVFVFIIGVGMVVALSIPRTRMGNSLLFLEILSS